MTLFVLALVPQATASEPFFPRAGSRAYDVSHYDVRLAYRSSGRVRAAATIVAVANRQLDQLSFDFFGPRVSPRRADLRPQPRTALPALALPAGQAPVMRGR